MSVVVTVFSLQEAQARWNVSAWLAEEILRGLVEHGLVEHVDEDAWRPTALGVETSATLNDYAQMLLEVRA